MPPKESTHVHREAIIQARLQIIDEKGVHALTITEIAGRAGMTSQYLPLFQWQAGDSGSARGLH